MNNRKKWKLHNPLRMDVLKLKEVIFTLVVIQFIRLLLFYIHAVHTNISLANALSLAICTLALCLRYIVCAHIFSDKRLAVIMKRGNGNLDAYCKTKKGIHP